jgi:hypothetical protein
MRTGIEASQEADKGLLNEDVSARLERIEALLILIADELLEVEEDQQSLDGTVIPTKREERSL